MADDGRAKRLKSSQDGGVVHVTDAELRGRVAELASENEKLRQENRQHAGGIAELESEIAKLRQENAQLRRRAGGIAALESENEHLRRRAQQQGGIHEVLPVIVATTVTVDLSRVDTSIVSHVTSFLGTARELLNLALACKSFGWRQPVSTLNWSLVEEVARQAVSSMSTDAEMSSLPRYVRGTATWLSILHKHEHLLMFDVLLGAYIEHRNVDKTTVSAAEGVYDRRSVAVSSGYVMKSGAHYAEFLINGYPYIGIVRPMPGLDASAYQGEFDFFGSVFYTDFLAQRSDDWGDSIGNVHACEFSCYDGEMGWTDWDDDDIFNGWEGMEGYQSDDTVGMLLNLDRGTLTVYKNNRRLGVMKDGLSGPYCWYVSLVKSQLLTGAVTIKRGTLPNSDGATAT
ncbi:hypothetical protein THAOC_01780 [Thalassiosira oceanica]|uniref:B30.2/SPRY domain-containing protein n=1 Tax=Thalassiosira oceanica TaxID=159749 RepID=K0TQQ5_THAOC|nr:hypothetical protein THAOC_01780 [Thalassiosira oceanica]|eukprot:EJK76457.1 hypothetical protein THAOC_01780 [Thalassiosira oceanica]